VILVRISNEKQNQLFEHAGVLEFGRAAKQEPSRCQLDDLYVSRDHLRVEELPNGYVRLENLSITRPVLLAGASMIPIGGTRSLALPVRITLGKTQVELDQISEGLLRGKVPSAAAANARGAIPKAGRIGVKESGEQFDSQSFRVLAETAATRLVKGDRPLAAAAGDGLVPETLARWLETVIGLQHAAPGSPEFYRQTAEALVNLIRLDLGLVLLRRQACWTVAGNHAIDDTISHHYSHTLLDHVATTRTTIYQDTHALKVSSISLKDIEAVVASPIFGVNEDVVGELYGVRVKGLIERKRIQPLEAQLVQLLAATVGAHLARSAALRTRVQFEQFFSPELVRELERNPDLLEGRDQDVTVLFSDLRGFTALSQRLGPENTCRLLRDVMERLSERIVQYQGVIVDYAGDGILAMWNAPNRQADHALRACHAALDMLGEMPGLNEKWRDLAHDTLALGIGINTGTAQVGNTGSSRKFKYGPHGHTVNLASRVQEATKRLGLPILLTAGTCQLIPPDLALRRLGRIRLRSVRDPVVLHELYGTRAPLGWQCWRDTYEQALSQYEAGQWESAGRTLLPLVSELEQAGQRDAPVLELMRRVKECLECRPDTFDPVLNINAE
jgi:adenylate cyclase